MTTKDSALDISITDVSWRMWTGSGMHTHVCKYTHAHTPQIQPCISWSLLIFMRISIKCILKAISELLEVSGCIHKEVNKYIGNNEFKHQPVVLWGKGKRGGDVDKGGRKMGIRDWGRGKERQSDPMHSLSQACGKLLEEGSWGGRKGGEREKETETESPCILFLRLVASYLL